MVTAGIIKEKVMGKREKKSLKSPAINKKCRKEKPSRYDQEQ